MRDGLSRALTVGIVLALLAVGAIAAPTASAPADLERYPAHGADAKARPAASDPVLVGAGDIARCSSTKDSATAALVSGIAGTVFTTGDNVYENGTSAEYTDCYDPTWGVFRDRTKPSAGNHDYRTPDAAGYYEYFGARAGDPTKGYYSYDLGTWHVIVLNSNCDAIGGCEADSAQGRWLSTDLASNDAHCTVAYWHHPRFSSGSRHGNDLRTAELVEILHDAGADVAMTGHDHHYERFAPMDPDGSLDRAHGLRHFVVGTGGTDLREVGTVEPNSRARNADDHGVLKLTLHPTSYSWEFVPIAGGSYTDSGTTDCVEPEGPEPPGPPGPIIVDERSLAFKRVGRQWRSGSTGWNGRHYFVPTRKGAARHIGRWKPTLPKAGRYKVHVRVARRSRLSRKALYGIRTASGWKKRTRDQQANRGTWLSLGTFDLTRSPKIRLRDNTGERSSRRRKLVFDAVRLMPTGPTASSTRTGSQGRSARQSRPG